MNEEIKYCNCRCCGYEKIPNDIALGTSPQDAYVRTNMKLKEEIKRVEDRIDSTNNYVKNEIERLEGNITEAYDAAKNHLDSAIENVTDDMDVLAARLDLDIGDVSNKMNQTIKTEVAKVDQRVDNIIANSSDTEGNSELIDIRTSVDGKVYSSAGTAVREQIENIMNAISKYNYTAHVSDLYWRLGTLSNVGKLSTSTKRVVSSFIYAKKGSRFSVNENYKFSLCKYRKTNLNSFFELIATRTSEYILDTDCYIRLTVGTIEDVELSDTSIAENMNVDIITLSRTKCFKTNVKLEGGYISTSDGLNGYDSIERFNNYLRTPNYIDVSNTDIIYFSLDENNSPVTVIAYDKNFNYILSTVTNSFTVDNDTAYIKILIDNNNRTINNKYLPAAFYGCDSYQECKNIKIKDTIKHFYSIDNGYINSMLLKLPPNYSNTGQSVPLIIFIQGSGDYNTVNSNVMSSNYEMYFNYLRDNGYAVWSCYGWGNKYSGGASTFGLPVNLECIKKGLDVLFNNYNIDPDRIAVSSKSLGGVLASLLCYKPEFNIKCCGMLAPQIDILYTNPFGYDKNKRLNIADNFQFEGNTEQILGQDTFTRNQDFADYINLNAPKISGYNAYWSNIIGQTLQQKVYNSIYHIFDNSLVRICSVPTKIWVAPDDEAISYDMCDTYIKQIHNGGGNAGLRTMPENTGGHHSVDTSANAPTVSEITTDLGIEYHNVPVAYTELMSFIKQYT